MKTKKYYYVINCIFATTLYFTTFNCLELILERFSLVEGRNKKREDLVHNFVLGKYFGYFRNNLLIHKKKDEKEKIKINSFS
jgi:hypothetical protein